MSQALSRPIHVLIQEDKLSYFKYPSLDFKILFAFGSWDDFGGLGCEIGTGPLFWVIYILKEHCVMLPQIIQRCASHITRLELLKLNLASLIRSS